MSEDDRDYDGDDDGAIAGYDRDVADDDDADCNDDDVDDDEDDTNGTDDYSGDSDDGDDNFLSEKEGEEEQGSVEGATFEAGQLKKTPAKFDGRNRHRHSDGGGVKRVPSPEQQYQPEQQHDGEWSKGFDPSDVGYEDKDDVEGIGSAEAEWEAGFYDVESTTALAGTGPVVGRRKSG